MDNQQLVSGYDKGAKFFHWSIVVLVVMQFVSAWIMPELRGATPPTTLVSLHMSFGVIVLVVMLMRVLWRITHQPPKLPPTLTRLEIGASHVVHYLLYLLLIALPFSGWAWASARGWEVNLFSAVKLPALLSAHSAYGRLAGNLHSGIATVVLLLIASHVGAALYHFYVKKDLVMERMLSVKNT